VSYASTTAPAVGGVEQRLRTLAVQSVAEFEYLPLAARKGVEDLAESVLPHRDLDLLVGEAQVAVGEEVAELSLVVVADGLVERHRVLVAATDLLDLAAREVKDASDLR
jgi:hypothetical protein